MPDIDAPELLLLKTSLDRVAGRLREVAPQVRILTMDGTGRFERDGKPIAPEDLTPQLAWANLDLFGCPKRDDFVKVMLDRSSLVWVQTAAAGLDAPVFQRLLSAGVRLCNSDAQAPSIAEFVVGSVMAHLQRWDHCRSLQAKRQWQAFGFRELGSTRWLIIGYGHIGRETARRLKGFGVPMVGIQRSPRPDDSVGEVATPDDLGRYLPQADVVLLCCPLTDATRGLVDAGFLARMKPGAMLVNVGRGGLVVESALLEALDGDRLAHAVLDVFETEPLPEASPFWSHPKVSVSSHSSSFGDGTSDRGDALFLDNLERYLDGKPLNNEVNRA